MLRFYCLTILVFWVAKLVFMLCYRGQEQFSLGDVFDVVLHGLSLDLSTALYCLIVPFLLTMASIWIAIPRWLFRSYSLFVAIVFSLAFVADTSLYAFWQFKLEVSCLSYLETPAEAMASVSTAYLLARVLIFIVVAAAIFFFLEFRGLSGKSATTPQDTPTAVAGSPLSTLNSKLKATAFYLLLIPMMVIGIRGGLSESTTNTGQVYYSSRQFLNHSAVNPVFSFFYSMDHLTGDLSTYEFFDPEECRKLTGNVFTTESLHKDTLLHTDRPNVVIILLESAGEQFASVMPHLQQLKREGVYFSRCYANSWRTDRGTLATLSGYPSFPTVSVMKIPEKSRTLPGIARTLKQQGYQTSYLYGGDINFTNMRSYLLSTGWDHLTSMDDYTVKERHSAKWGVRDDITFATLLQQITSCGQQQSPFLMGYSTLSSHEPWDVPLKRHDDEVLNAFAYLDDCLYHFIEQLRQTPQWDQLLLVLVADHGVNHGDVSTLTPLRKNHIPMLWLGGAVRQPRVVNMLCSQSDLAATLLGQMNLSHDDFSFSRDVLSETYVYPTAVHNYTNAQWMVDSTGHALYDFDAQRLILSEGTDTQRLLRVSKAILQVTSADLANR